MHKILSNPETWPLNLLDSAQAKHRCLYVELNFLFKLGSLFSIKLEIADRYHKLYSQTECIYDSANKPDLSKMNSELTSALINISSASDIIWKIAIELIKNIVKHTDNPTILNKQKEIKDLVKNILNEKTRLLKYFQKNEAVSENRISDFIGLINSFINILREIYQKPVLKPVFIQFFYQACRICEAFLVYQNWEKTRDQKIAIIQQEKNKLALAHKIKHLLYFEKVLFFKKSYNELKSRQTEIMILTIGKIAERKILEPDKTIEDIVSDLQKEKSQLQKKIIRDESQLKNYGHFTSLLAGFIRCSSDNFYYQTGKELFQLMENATQSEKLSKIPIFKEKLKPQYLAFFSSLLGIIYLGAELIASPWTGLSYNMMQSMSRLLLYDIDMLTHCFEKIGYDEKTAIRALPYLENGLGLGLNIGFTGYLLGSLTPGIALFSSGRYLTGQLVQWLGSKTTGLVLDRHAPKLQTLGQGFVGFGCFIAGGKLFTSYFGTQLLHRNIPYDPDNILFSEEMCKAYPDECQKKAAAILKVDIHVSKKTIRDAFHFLSLSRHQDKGGTKKDSIELNLAYNYLKNHIL